MPLWTQKICRSLLKPEFRENPEKACRVIVEMASPYTDKIMTFVEENAGKVHRELRIIPLMVIEAPYETFKAMAMLPHVRKIWNDTKVKTLLDVAIPSAGGAKAHELGFTGKDVTVAVIDTGVFTHPDLLYPTNRIVGWNDLVNQRPIPYDDNGHGTHVSGIIAGNGVTSRGKYIGMAPETNLVCLKVLDNEGAGNISDAISALEWCVENQETYNIKAINMSFGAAAEESAWEDPLCRAVSSAWNKGMVVCVAAGNDGPDFRSINSPGISPNAITVGNLDDKDTLETDDDIMNDSSSRGPTIDNLMKPDILAPGTNITSLRVGGGYKSLSGTSMATPMVTGAVAQIYQQWPDLKPDQIKGFLRRNSRGLGFQSGYGSGALNVDGFFEENKKSNTLKDAIYGLLFGSGPLVKKPLSKR